MSYPNDIAGGVQIALTIVQQAAQLARRIQAEMISSAMQKTDRSPVTVADFAIQALVARRLLEAFPDDPLMAEEDASALRSSPLLDQVTGFVSSLAPEANPQMVCDWIDRGHMGIVETGQRLVETGRRHMETGRRHVETGRRHMETGQRPVSTPAPARYWLLDPIDGTKGFLRGGQYAVALALMVNGQAQIGVLGCPELELVEGAGGALVYAVRGQGTWATALDAQAFPNLRLSVSDRGDPARARLLRSFEAGHTNVGQIEQFAAALGIRAEPVLMDSQVKYAVLAAGQGDIILRLLSPERPDYREKAWDQAAGSLVVEEAGGRVTDLSGNPFDFTQGRELIHNHGVLVTNGRLHQVALQALRAIGA